MYEYAIIWEWLSFAARWLHVITAIAWIGSSFYFIALDLSLQKNPNLPKNVHGEEWQVHGGGFYHIQKYLVAPAELPTHLTWFKWESYATWVSGFALMCIVYYAGADLYLIDRNLWDVEPWVGILTSIGTIVISYLIYDLLCKSKLGQQPTLLMVLLYLILIFAAWGYTQIFTGRAAFLHLGAITATIMSCNVFMVIIPNQKVVVADLIANKTPDPKYGKIAKLRSTHNNYLTLPVIFLMLSNHYPLAFGTEYNWVIASLVFLMGVTIRHYFNSMHARSGKPTWTWAVTIIIFLIIMWLSTVPKILNTNISKIPKSSERFLESQEFENVQDIILTRCSMCHAEEPGYMGIHTAPKNVLLETKEQIARYARDIYLQAGRSNAMPPANVSWMEKTERALLVKWYEESL
ncbi:MAG: urate hydroxylase PuuD [Paracoccaceae bacterium]|nr:urate hydroxylase PuuD [Paracoccaceae bacterium]